MAPALDPTRARRWTTLLRPAYWGGHLLVVLAVAATVALGFWQLGAWQAHRAAEARDLSGAAPEPLAEAMGPDDPFPGDYLGHPVEVTGTWMPGSSFSVSDRLLDGRRGFWVVTPVLTGAGSAIPVVRGWSSEPGGEAPSGRVDLTGWLQAPEGNGAVDPDPTDDVLAQMRIGSMVERVDADLYSGYVVGRDLSGVAAAGLRSVPPSSVPAVSTTTALRNLLYAIQWWIFAGFAVYVWGRWCLDQLAPPAPAEESEDREPAPSGV